MVNGRGKTVRIAGDTGDGGGAMSFGRPARKFHRFTAADADLLEPLVCETPLRIWLNCKDRRGSRRPAAAPGTSTNAVTETP